MSSGNALFWLVMAMLTILSGVLLLVGRQVLAGCVIFVIGFIGYELARTVFWSSIERSNDVERARVESEVDRLHR